MFPSENLNSEKCPSSLIFYSILYQPDGFYLQQQLGSSVTETGVAPSALPKLCSASKLFMQPAFAKIHMVNKATKISKYQYYISAI